MLKKLSLVYLVVISSLYAGEINIAVAANVSYAIEDLKKEFHKEHPNTQVKVTLGSSGKLTAQIRYGAPYQVFMSANMKYPNALYSDKIAITKPIVYAQGSLACVSNQKRDFSQGLKIVKHATIKRVAVANPKTAPYGIATAEALKNAGLYQDVKNKFIYGESISQTISYAVKVTDLGFIAKSSLFSPKMGHFKKGSNWIDVDAKLYTPIKQGVVLLKKGEKSQEALAFYKFILSDKAKDILQKFGYLIP